jgi:DNA-binding MarR family transcriptional regulator
LGFGVEEMTKTEELRRLLKSFRRIAHTLDVQSRRINASAGLTLPQLVVLSCVRDLGEVTSREISEEADISPATVVGILDNLAAKGLIERYRSTRDRRVVHTRLTEAGVRALRQTPSPLGDTFEAAYFGLEKRRRDAIIDAFEQILSLAPIAAINNADDR